MTVSLNFRQSAFAQETGVFPIHLVTLDHADWATPVRLSSDPTARLIETASDIVYGTTSNGNDYYFFPAAIKLPSDKDDGPGDLRINFDNVNRDYIAQIRALDSPISVQVDIVMSNALDTIERSWPEFELRRIPYDAASITGVMTMETLEGEPFPAGSFLPSTTPNVY